MRIEEEPKIPPEIPPEIPKIEEPIEDIIPYKDQMKIRKLYAGLPIFTATPTYTGFQGEIVLVDTGAARSICAYLGGTWYCATLT